MSQEYLNNNTYALRKSINDIKSKLHNSINIDDVSVSESLLLSQELDELIVQYYQER